MCKESVSSKRDWHLGFVCVVAVQRVSVAGFLSRASELVRCMVPTASSSHEHGEEGEDEEEDEEARKELEAALQRIAGEEARLAVEHIQRELLLTPRDEEEEEQQEGGGEEVTSMKRLLVAVHGAARWSPYVSRNDVVMLLACGTEGRADEDR